MLILLLVTSTAESHLGFGQFSLMTSFFSRLFVDRVQVYNPGSKDHQSLNIRLLIIKACLIQFFLLKDDEQVPSLEKCLFITKKHLNKGVAVQAALYKFVLWTFSFHAV